MARIPEEVIRSIQDAVDIVDVISRYVTLKRSGSSFAGLCPFHEEKTPSFHVFPSSARYKCFGCGEGGDAFTFLMRRKGLAFLDAVEELARETGIALPTPVERPGEAEQRRRRGEVLRALAFAAEFYRVVLGRETGRAARRYLEGRGFTAATLAGFAVGYAPDEFEGLRAYALRKGFTDEILFDAGLARRNERGQPFDMFRGRIMFPIHDLGGQVIGFGARALGDAQPKYLNSPDGPLFHKSREMYGLALARQPAREAGRLLVVEGYTDVMQCHQAGVRETAAGLGTALTPENARQLRRFNVPVVLLFDGDDAGLRAAERACDVLLEEQVEGSVALLPAGKDPADVLVAGGRGALEAALEGALDLWEYRLQRAVARHGTETLGGRAAAAGELAEAVRRIRDPLRQEVALQLLVERLGVSESSLRDRIARGRPAGGPAQEAGKAPVSGAWTRGERDLIAAALADDAFWDRVEAVHPPGEFRDPVLRQVAEGLHDLRRGGESLSRENLLGVLADRDEAVRALQAIEVDDGARERAQVHLEQMAEGRRRRSALEASDLEAAVRARKEPEAGSP